MTHERWAPRSVIRLDPWQSGAMPLKAYGILADGTRPLEQALVSAAARAVSAAAGDMATTAHEGVGFVILHRDVEDAWLLLHWWLEGSSCAQRLWRRARGGRSAFTALDRPFMACVWELALIDHERRAFVRTMMAVRDPEAYLKDIYRPGFC